MKLSSSRKLCFYFRNLFFTQIVFLCFVVSSVYSQTQTPNKSNPLDLESTFFSTAHVQNFSGYDTKSKGDLWPSCWADDGDLYVANGDGFGFGKEKDDADLVVSRVFGMPETGLTGEIVARGASIANIWDTSHYNRKPTGMIAVDGDGNGKDELYLAVQDLNANPCPECFNDAPNASISKSTDYGKSWIKTDSPMFTDHVFTTIFFLDYGKSSENVKVLGHDAANYVYAYGIDYNWRSPTDNTKPKPADLFLARVPKDKIQERSSWEFYEGKSDNNEPLWNSDINKRKPVLHDERKVYPSLGCGGRPKGAIATDVGVISQGGVVYNEPLDRYIYSSWTWYTFEFYESPNPWGPWKLFLHKDFGAEPFIGESDKKNCEGLNEGGYTTTIPSKFISDDGKTMWVQSNSWARWNYECGSSNYNYSLRKLMVEPFTPSKPNNKPDSNFNIAISGSGTTPIEKSAHHGYSEFYNDGNKDQTESSIDCDKEKKYDFWGYVWEKNYNMNRVVFTSGAVSDSGGWFDNSNNSLRVQVRQNFEWVDVKQISVSPNYSYNESAAYKSYVFDLKDTWGDGIRIIGNPGGSSNYTTIAELEVYYVD